jgi:hypothetical protein
MRSLQNARVKRTEALVVLKYDSELQSGNGSRSEHWWLLMRFSVRLQIGLALEILRCPIIKACFQRVDQS